MAATTISRTETSSGSYTVPTGSWYVVSCYVAGGGGGGGGGSGGYGGGGGGQSAFSLKNGCAILLTGGNTISFTIGTGGAGGSAGANGSNGSASSVTFGSTTFTTGYGEGGTAGTGSGGGVGGASTDTGAPGNDAGFSDVGGDGGGGAGGGSGAAGTTGFTPGGGGGGGADGFAGGAGGVGRVTYTLLAADVLGTRANPFIAAAGTTLDIQTSTLVEGDVGSISGNTIVTPSPVTGTVHSNDSAIQNANTDATSVYNVLRVLPAIEDYTGFALGQTTSPDLSSLPPGVYSWSGAAQVINNFTLNGAGIYIFQVVDGGGIPGTFRVEDGANMILGTGARPENVYFVTQSGIDVRAATNAIGNFITAGNITANPIGSLFMYGRLLAPSGSVTIGRLEGRLPSAFCYAKDTGILTERGYIPICDIQLTDRIVSKGEFTPDGKVIFKEESLKKVTFVGKFTVSHITKGTAPICFTKGSLGKNMPFQDLIVSPNHAIVYNGNKVGANWFVNDLTVFRMMDVPMMEYYVIELEDHSVIDANGVLSESMLGDSSAFVPVAYTEKIEMHLPMIA